MCANETQSRIVVVDCLRGLALFGLFVVHMVEYFELFWYAPEWGWVHDTVFFLFGGKAYAMFSLLFGLSFFIIMDNQARRGVDFRARFAWRLTVLLAMGYLHGLLYSGDVLQVLAIAGFVLLACFRVPSAWLLAGAAALLLQLPALLIGLLWSEGEDPLHWSVMATTFEIYANGSLAEVLQRNTWMGQAGKWLFMLESGRFWNVLGFALLGFVLGRRRFFRDEGQSLRHLAVALSVTLLALIALHLAGTHWAALSEGLAGTLLGQYRNNLMTLAGVALFLLAWEVRWLRRPMTWLAPPGRMSLSVYVSQSLYGVPLFYGFGLGLYQGLGQVNALLLGLALWAVQLLIAAAWLRRYHYGPLEWAWRAATYTRLDVPWRRPDRHA